MRLSSVSGIVDPAVKLGTFTTASLAADRRMSLSLLLLQGLLTHERKQRIGIVVDGHGMGNAENRELEGRILCWVSYPWSRS